MRRIAIVLLAGLATFVLVIPAEATTTVDIVDFAFSPSSTTVPIGSTVTWDNMSTMNTHTSTQDQGVWNTGNITHGNSANETISWAGTYAYHCAIHSQMVATVKVPIQVTPPSGDTSTTFTITYASGPMPTNFRATIQKRVGNGSWSLYLRRLTGTTTTFMAGTPGTYSFRSYLVGPNGKTKASPKASIKIN